MLQTSLKCVELPKSQFLASNSFFLEETGASYSYSQDGSKNIRLYAWNNGSHGDYSKVVIANNSFFIPSFFSLLSTTISVAMPA